MFVSHNLHHIIKKTVSGNDYQSNILEDDLEKDNGCNRRPPKNHFKKVSQSNDKAKLKKSFTLLQT